MEIWTIGHSRRSMEEFIALLKPHRIGAVADVRRFAVSARCPQFNEMALFKELERVGIEYVSFSELGGRRRPAAQSPNLVWRSESFRGYADYMMTAEFERGVERLLALAAEKRVAMMCAELPWWRCHRALIADCLKARGVRVVHIFGEGKTEEHPYTSPARVEKGRVSYTGPVNLELSLK